MKLATQKQKQSRGKVTGLVIADPHVGSYAGLCHPDHFADGKQRRRIRHAQEEAYSIYEKWTKDFNGIDVLLVNGDAIEGKGKKSGGVELWAPDLLDQVECCSKLIRMFNAKRIIMSYGTNYHVATDSGERLEKVIANYLNVGSNDISNRNFLDISGVKVDMRHYLSSSSVPHTRATALSREMLWDSLLHEYEKFPKIDILLRSHVHYHIFTGNSRQLAMTTPALQLPFTHFGGAICSGNIDWGIISFEANNGEFKWKSHIVNLESAKPEINYI